MLYNNGISEKKRKDAIIMATTKKTATNKTATKKTAKPAIKNTEKKVVKYTKSPSGNTKSKAKTNNKNAAAKKDSKKEIKKESESNKTSCCPKGIVDLYQDTINKCYLIMDTLEQITNLVGSSDLSAIDKSNVLKTIDKMVGGTMELECYLANIGEVK